MIPRGTKQHPKFTNYYITKDGKVWSKRRNTAKGGWLKSGAHTQGYRLVGLSQDGKYTTRFIHRLVLETYIGICPVGKETLHKNGNVIDNRLSNLKWGTHKENMRDREKHGTNNQAKGEQHYRTTLTNKDVRTIIYIYHTNLFTQRELAKQYKISAVEINRIIKRKRWKHLGVVNYE